MAYPVKVFDTPNLTDRSSAPGVHMIGGENQFQQVVLHMCCAPRAHGQAQIHKHGNLKSTLYCFYIYANHRKQDKGQIVNIRKNKSVGASNIILSNGN